METPPAPPSHQISEQVSVRSTRIAGGLCSVEHFNIRERPRPGRGPGDDAFAEFEQAVLDHAEHEEQEEFPPVRAGVPAHAGRDGRGAAGAEMAAPTHPHPSTAGSPIAQWMVGPWASLIDQARDAGAQSLIDLGAVKSVPGRTDVF
jgi:hypothetical protein